MVTGAASGIGRACALLLAQRGATVGLVDRDADGLEILESELRANGALTVIRPADVSNPEAIADAVSELAQALTGLEIAINAAGIEGSLGPLAELEDDALEAPFAVNVRGVFLAMKHEIRAMRKSGGGAIVNMCSIYGVNGQPRFGLYAATKHAVAGLTKTAALENAAAGVRINAVAPGPIATPLLERATGGDPERVVRNIPMRRLGQPEEVARAALWLASSEAGFVTGHLLSVDGGMIAQAANTPD